MNNCRLMFRGLNTSRKIDKIMTRMAGNAKVVKNAVAPANRRGSEADSALNAACSDRRNSNGRDVE